MTSVAIKASKGKKFTRLLNLSTLSLEPFDADEMPPYLAVSHAWSENLFPVSCYNGAQVESCDGLESVQCAIKNRSDNIQFIWVDSWSIDQTDENDKNHQIPIMGKIFKRSRLVLVVVRHCFTFGQAEWESVLSSLENELMVYRSPQWQKVLSLSDSKKTKSLKRGVQLIDELASLEWMRRIWTSQEYILAEDVEWMGFGEDQSPLRLLATDLRDLLLMYRHAIQMEPMLPQNLANAFTMINARSGRIDPTFVMQLAINRSCTRIEDQIYGLMGASEVLIEPIMGENVDIETIWQAWWEEAVRQGHLLWIVLPLYESHAGQNCIRPSFECRGRALTENGSWLTSPLGPVEVEDGTVQFWGYNAGVCILGPCLGQLKSNILITGLVELVHGDLELASRIAAAVFSGYESERGAKAYARFECALYHWNAAGIVPDYMDVCECQIRFGNPNPRPRNRLPAGKAYLATIRNTSKSTDAIVIVDGEIPQGQGELMAVSVNTFVDGAMQRQSLLVLHDPETNRLDASQGSAIKKRSLHRVGITSALFVAHGEEEFQRAKKWNGHIIDAPSQQFAVGGNACSYCHP